MCCVEKHIVEQTNKHCRDAARRGCGVRPRCGGRSLIERSPIEIMASNADDY